MDSGAFSTILSRGGYPEPVSEYAAQIERWRHCGNLLAAVSQDYMCEPAMLAKTGLTVRQHQEKTIERYLDLLSLNPGVYIMPVLQGYSPKEYLDHVEMYGDLLKAGSWVGVGSICKRNGNPFAIFRVLDAIKDARPDLKLHGFGLKTTALSIKIIRDLLYSADSMAWSFADRREGRNRNDWREAKAFSDAINSYRPNHAQASLFT